MLKNQFYNDDFGDLKRIHSEMLVIDGTEEMQRRIAAEKTKSEMKIYIKNMVCQGTKKYVLLEVKKMGLNLKSFEAAELEFSGDLSQSQMIALDYRLSRYGLETSAGVFTPAFQAEPSSVLASA